MNIKLSTDPKTFLSSGPPPDVFSGLLLAALQKYAPIDDVVARRVDEDPPDRGSAAVGGGGAGPLAGRGGGFGAFLRLRRWASCRLRRRGHCFHHLRGRMRIEECVEFAPIRGVARDGSGFRFRRKRTSSERTWLDDKHQNIRRLLDSAHTKR